MTVLRINSGTKLPTGRQSRPAAGRSLDRCPVIGKVLVPSLGEAVVVGAGFDDGAFEGEPVLAAAQRQPA